MKKLSILIISCLFALFAYYGVDITFQAMSGKSLIDYLALIKNTNFANKVTAESFCSNKSKVSATENATSPYIKKLNEYQIVCNSFATDELMVFTSMPKDGVGARNLAITMAGILKDFSTHNIKPIVVVEPETDWGLVDFSEFGTGFYDPFLKEYFTTLLKEGITDNIMGTWVPFPEANLPYWNRSDSSPNDFGVIVNKYLGILKSYFPNSKGSILLNSATYSSDDFDWSRGEYMSLIPYVEKIDPKLIDSFGLQGFPWIPVQGAKNRPILYPSAYLNYKLAVEAANKLGTKKIWFNTGSFSAKYTNDPDAIVYMDPSQRKEILVNTIEEAKKILAIEGFSVSINLFAKDKSNTTEATNWSYWDTPATFNQDHLVLIDFLYLAEQNEISVSLFDSVQ